MTNVARSSLPSAVRSRGVVFIIDRVMHYHAATMQAVELRLAAMDIPFALLSAQDNAAAVGRVAYREPVVRNQQQFRLTERPIGNFMLRVQHDLIDLVSDLRPAVVISTCHSGTLSEWRLLAWARRRGIRSVAWQCGYEYNPGTIKRLALSRFIPLFDFHLCYHSNAQRYALAHGAKPDQTLVMHNTIDEAKILPEDRVAARAALVARWPELAGKKIVLYVGAVLAEKRLDDVFSALDQLADPNLSFVLVGDGPYLPVLRQRYAGRSDWVCAGRVVDGVGAFFDAADVFVLPGTGGLAINEAMAHRLPVISGYADGSADDLVVDGETGYRLAEESPSALSASMSQFFAHPARAAAMGINGEQRIRGKLSFQCFIDRVVGVLLAQHRQATGG